jgi:hypothetical protein
VGSSDLQNGVIPSETKSGGNDLPPSEPFSQKVSKCVLMTLLSDHAYEWLNPGSHCFILQTSFMIFEVVL